MAGLVEEIQRDALDKNVRVSDLLRKVKVAAIKLQLGEVESWVENELNGYHGSVPPYRVLYGQPRAWNPYNGWIPIMMGSERDNDLIAACPLMQSLPSLEDVIERSSAGHLEVPFPPSLVAELNKNMRVSFGRMANHLSHSQVGEIVNHVRNMILDWVLTLEKSGVTGEGLTFNADERQRAKGSAVIYNFHNSGNFAGNFGEGNTAGTITLNAANWAELEKFVEQVEKASGQLGSEGADEKALSNAISLLKVEVTKPHPDRSKVHGLLTDMRNAVSGAAGSLIASGISAQIASFLGS